MTLGNSMQKTVKANREKPGCEVLTEDGFLHTNCSVENCASYFHLQKSAARTQIILNFLQRAMSYKYFKQLWGYVNQGFSLPYLRIHKTAVKSVSLCAFQALYICNIMSVIVSWACSVQQLICLSSTEIRLHFWQICLCQNAERELLMKT